MNEFLTVAGIVVGCSVLGGLAFVYFIHPRLPVRCTSCGWHGTNGERMTNLRTGWHYCPHCDDYFD